MIESTMALTPWFDGHLKPDLAGVYQRICPETGGIRYSHWNGIWWGSLCMDVEGALGNGGHRSEYQRLRWRGLVSDPTPVPDQALEADAARYRWLMSDCDGDEQDNVLQWLAKTVASKMDIDRRIDGAMGGEA